MDEIEYKLNTKNSVLVVNGIEKLISTVKSKYKPAERQKFVLDNEELKFLREKCSSKDTVVSLTACQGLLVLVESGVLEIGHTMSTVITLLPTAQNYSAIISTMAGLLILDLKSRLVPGQPYSCQFSLRSPQHPFITVLEKSSEATEDVLTQMHALCTHPDYTVSSNSLELLRAVFLWLTSHPSRGGDARPWRLLLSLQRGPNQARLLLDCLSWQQTSNPRMLESAFAAYSAVTETVIYQKDSEYVTAILPLLARLSNELIRHGRDPRPCYSLMERCCALETGAERAAGLLLALLADNLTHTCALHLHELFNLCLTIISKYEYPSISLNIFVALSLQWLHLPSSLTTNALKAAAKIVDTHSGSTKEYTRLDMPNLVANPVFQNLLYTDKKLATTFALFKTWERLRDNPDKLRSWLDGLERVDSVVQLDLAGFLIGVLMERRKEEFFEDVALRCLKIVLKLVDVMKELSVQLLPVLLYKIANDPSPRMKMECLKALPSMAKSKENVPTIVSILGKLKSSKSVPTSFLIHLHSALTLEQVRCFPYLQEVLLDSPTPGEAKWELELARAKATADCCRLRPPQGLELVSLISSLLNRCTDAAGAPAAAASLQALLCLWRHNLVAPPSTWAALEPKLGRDKRTAVQISICDLLGEVPKLRVPTPEYDRLVSSGAARLWRYVSEGGVEVIGAACRALAHYGLDYPLAAVPEIYRKTVQLPASFCKTPADAARKPEEVLDYIPCEVWPEVFKYTNQAALDSVRHLAERLIAAEVRGYRSGVYHPAGPGEPPSLSYLPAASVARGLWDFLRKQATKPTYDCSDAALVSILQTLGAEHPMPLPPADLCFLHELFARGAGWRRPCLLLAARQASASGSGSRLLHNYLLEATPDKLEESDIETIFLILPQLSRNMPPNSIREPIEKCLADSYNKIANTKAKDYKGDPKDLLFVRQMEWIAQALEYEKIHDANRTLLSQIVEGYMPVIGDDNVAFPGYLHACRALSSERVERMSSPSGWWECSGALLRAAAALRCEAALRGGLNWLGEIVDAAADFPPEQEYTLRRILPALQAATPDDAARQWLLQLMGRAQVAFTEKDNDAAKAFIWDVFVLSVVALSGYWSFEPDVAQLAANRERRCALFPNAAGALFAREGWSDHVQKVTECLIHARAVHPVSSAARSCQRALHQLTDSRITSALWSKAVWDMRLYD